MEQSTKSTLRTSHTWHRCNEHDCFVCNGGLSQCVVCGGAEVQLPRDCPGKPMTEEQKIAITNDYLDFHKGRWWRSIQGDEDVTFSTIAWRADKWLHECVGADVVNNLDERNHRFFEEALELLQACGYTRQQIDAMADYVYSKSPSTDIASECADVLICLLPLAKTRNIDLGIMTMEVLTRNWKNINRIREKNRHKPIRAGRLR